MKDRAMLRGKLALYLSTLSDSAQNLLLRTLEKSEATGKNDAASDLILAALRDVLRENEEDVFLEEHARKELFKTSMPFVADIDLVNKVDARISPSSIEAIWQWIKRDIAKPEQLEMLELQCNGLSTDEIRLKTLEFCKPVMAQITQYVNKIKREIGGDQKLGNQLGGEIVFADLLDLMQSAERVKEVQPTMGQLPSEIESWTSTQGAEAFAAITSYVQQVPLRTAWIFSAVTKRLSNTRLLLQLSTKLAGSDDAVQVAATVYAPGVVQVMAEMDGYLHKFDQALEQHLAIEECIAILSQWRSSAKVLEAELELAPQTAWGKHLAAMKAKLSELLEKEIAPAPGLIRQALRAPKDGAAEVADENLLQDATRAAEFFHHAERMRDSLALNEPIGRIRKELDQMFEMLTTSLVERTRNASGNDIATCKTLGDAACIFARYLVDDEYASAFGRQLRAASSAQEMQSASA